MKENREKLKGYLVEYSVGTILWWNGREIEVVQDPPAPGGYICKMCVLRKSRTCGRAVECRSYMRKDGIGVHFENVRKEERI